MASRLTMATSGKRDSDLMMMLTVKHTGNGNHWQPLAMALWKSHCNVDHDVNLYKGRRKTSGHNDIDGHYDDEKAKIKSDLSDGDDQEVESLMMPSRIQLPMATTVSSRKATVKISILIPTSHLPLTICQSSYYQVTLHFCWVVELVGLEKPKKVKIR